MKTTLLRAFALFSAAWLCMGGAKADVAPDEPTADGAGVYQIGTAANLVWFSDYVNANTANIKAKAVLTADIDMSDVENFTPIGLTSGSGTHNSNDYAYKGTFDGQGHTISNLTIAVDDTEPWQVGLFGRINAATVSNIGLHTVNITQTSTTAAAAGALAGRNGSSTVTNCYAINVSFTQTKSASSGGGATSGLVGYMSASINSRIINCYTDHTRLTILGTDKDGNVGSATNCYSGGTTADGIEAINGRAATGELCYLLNGDQSNIVWKQNLGTDSYPVLNSDHKTVSLALGCDGSKAYNNTGLGLNNHSFETGSCTICGMAEGGDYEIDGAGKLLWFGAQVNAGHASDKAKLTNNIIMTGEPWLPMSGFVGTFDGDNHTISNLNAPLCLTTGDGAVIKNLTLAGALTSTQNRFGAFICDHTAGALTISNCVNATAITSKNDRSGGFIGNVNDGTVAMTDCQNTAALTSTLMNLAGFIGDTSGSSTTLTRCYNYGTVTGVGSTSVQISGLVGTFRGAAGTRLRLEQCGNEAAIGGKKNDSGNSNVAGLVAWVNSQTDKEAHIVQCYNIAPITATGNFVGSFAGQISSNSKLFIEDSYNTGDVKSDGTTDVRMLVGRQQTPANGSITNCWNSGRLISGTEAKLIVSGASVTNCYNVNDAPQDGVTIVTAAQLANGEVTYKLNGDQSDGIWRQTLGTDMTPKLTADGDMVYPFATSGTTPYFVNNESSPVVPAMTLTDMEDYVSSGNFTATSLTYNRTLEEGGYHSLCLPFAIKKSDLPSGSKLFTLSAVGTDAVTLNEVDEEVAAGTPCFASVTSNFTFGEMTDVEMVASVTNGERLKGTFTEITGDGAKGVYKLSGDGTYFGQTAAVEGDVTEAPVIWPFRSYIAAGGGSVKTLNILLSDGTSLTPTLSEEREAVIYDLAGRRVEKATKGLYIVNGKKVVK